ncbi:hypothetical protein FPZ24_08130 [Sphingomonas panacisoli]|uniref:Uncharacterized protein n=1 Tax=Sphingomonas panacisoli TaxID=1813879 RepID=A0A5B8LHD8_9SPHN|nr:hypothetical protein [Sphingomonas panacisoli]QDZ07451.1 hypothetical protein FPZ24_08130 [Sphingomonas panacisoli]
MSWEDLLPRPGQGSGVPEAVLGGMQARSAIDQNNAQTQLIGAQVQKLNDQQTQERQYQYDVAQYLKNPTPEATLAMFSKYPEQANALSKGYAVKDEAARNSDIGYFGSLYSALDKGNTPIALSTLRQRRDADQRAGLDTTLDDDWIAALEGGDTTASATIKGAVLANLAAAAGRDKFAQNFGAVGGSRELKSANAGDWVYDQQGNVVFKVPQADQYKSVGQGDTLVKIPGEGGAPTGGAGQYVGGWTPRARNGGDNADNVVDNKISGMATALGVGPDESLAGKSPLDIAKALTLSEGGPGSLADRNNNPGNLTDPKTGQFRKFPTKEAGLAAAAAQVARNLKRGQTTIRSMVEGLPVGGSSQSGGATVVATGQPKAKDAPNGYQWSADGAKLEPIPGGPADKGAATAALKPWPSKQLEARVTNDASIQNIDNAMRLLDPKNNSPEAKAARAAVGPFTGALGDQFTHWNDPGGDNFRALVGQIGGVIIKDISGAAVSATEDARLAKWVPKVNDPPATIAAKLRNLRREIEQRNLVMDRVARDQGYRPFGGSAPAAPASGGWGKATRVK